ncbi:hypothetical protein WMW72_34235 [Paenibacillus filicis]|uniref:Uncharacterized protein n=1 Tax=Paenibacillus filicis TaxID=669464 RepID=A0ABU9DVN9_9BACL
MAGTLRNPTIGEVWTLGEPSRKKYEEAENAKRKILDYIPFKIGRKFEIIEVTNLFGGIKLKDLQNERFIFHAYKHHLGKKVSN